jgi:hypothetical protein
MARWWPGRFGKSTLLDILMVVLLQLNVLRDDPFGLYYRLTDAPLCCQPLGRQG